MRSNKAFTLIELLVVIAIIGILASVVIASLNSARSKGQEAAIKSNLKNMSSQAEILYLNANPNSYSAVCAGLTSMITAIGSAGGAAACNSHDGTRWGATARLNSAPTKNWSVDQTGVVVWDTSDAGGGMRTWTQANSDCAALGARMPSIEYFKTIYAAHAVPPPSFQVNNYWSGTEDPSNSANAYLFDMVSNSVFSGAKTNTFYVRCVR